VGIFELNQKQKITNMENQHNWPALNFPKLQDTLETLHQWIQIVGKIRLKTMPWQNHSWHTTLYVTTNGFSTYSIPFEGRAFQIDFDFKVHKLFIRCSNRASVEMDLRPRTVADFYEELFEKLSLLDINVKIYARPNEMEPAIPFQENTVNTAYDPEQANALWQVMMKVNEVFSQFRSQFIGKASPVHLFWGAFDLAVTRFSGNPAPLHQGGMPNMPLDVMQEAYSQEVSSAGFWPGSKDFPIPIFYSYAYPAAEDFAKQKVLPEQAFYSQEMGEFILNYDDVRNSESPEKTLYDFLQSTYEAAASTSHWDRNKLEKQP
jgi:hypothetical protein